MEKQPKVKKEKKQKKEQLYNTSVDLEVTDPIEDSDETKEVIEETFTSIFIPKERKDPNKIINDTYNNMALASLKAFSSSLELAYTEQKNRWESEEKISKIRREYLQDFYDKLGDIKLTIIKKEKLKQ